MSSRSLRAPRGSPPRRRPTTRPAPASRFTAGSARPGSTTRTSTGAGRSSRGCCSAASATPAIGSPSKSSNAPRAKETVEHHDTDVQHRRDRPMVGSRRVHRHPRADPQYAAATNDPIASTSRATSLAGVRGRTRVRRRGPGRVAGDPVELLMMILHGEQDFHFHGPILPDTTLTTRAAAIGMQPRSSGVTVIVKTETRDGRRPAAERAVHDHLRPRRQAEAGTGESAPTHAFDESLRSREPDARGNADVRRRSDLPLLRGVGRPDADPPRRRARQGDGAAGNHHPRALHDGVHVAWRRSSTPARRTRRG